VSDLDDPYYGAWMPDDFSASESWDQVLHQPDYSSARPPQPPPPAMAFRPRGRTGPQYAPAHPYGPAPDSGPITTYQPWDLPTPGYPPVPDYPHYPPQYPPGPGYPPPDSAGYWPPASELLAPTAAPRPSGPATPPAARPAGPAPLAGRVLCWLPFGHRLILLSKSPGNLARSEHRDVTGGWLRPAVFGAMDGLVTNSSLIAGVGGGGGGHGAIVLTGVAGLIAGAFSMATGEYISVQSQNELAEAEVELEKRQHTTHPGQKLDRLTDIYIEKGVSPNLAEAVAGQISADPAVAVATHLREDPGHRPGRPAVPADRGAGLVRGLHRRRAAPAEPVPARDPEPAGRPDRGRAVRAGGRGRGGQAHRAVDAERWPAPVRRRLPGLRDRPPRRRPSQLSDPHLALKCSRAT